MRLRHATSTRGLMSTRTSPFFEGTFGRMFRAPCAAQFGSGDAENLKNLAALGEAMSASQEEPKDGQDDEEGGSAGFVAVHHCPRSVVPRAAKPGTRLALGPSLWPERGPGHGDHPSEGRRNSHWAGGGQARETTWRHDHSA